MPHPLPNGDHHFVFIRQRFLRSPKMLVVPLQTFKLLLILPHFLVPTLFAVSDFTQQLATIEEQHGEQLQQLVETFRIRNAELRKER